MKLIDLYNPFVGTEGKFIDQYPPETQDLAQNFWIGLNATCPIFILVLFGVSIVLCVGYYTVWNELPGRHYRRSHWLGAYIITLLVTFFGTAAVGYAFNNTSLNGSASLIWDISIGNFIYSIVLYGLLSLGWSKWGPTNAYRLIGKK